MNEREFQFHQEIASLQTRVAQLTSTQTASERVLSSLASEAEALSASDATGAARLARKMTLIRQRSREVANEIGTLQQLIAARRRLGGAAVPGFM